MSDSITTTSGNLEDFVSEMRSCPTGEMAGEAVRVIESLISELEDTRKELSDTIEGIKPLQAFRSSVIGWREHGQSDDYCRFTAEAIATQAEEDAALVALTIQPPTNTGQNR